MSGLDLIVEIIGLKFFITLRSVFIVILSSKPLLPTLNVSKKNPLIFQKFNQKLPENNIKIVLDNLSLNQYNLNHGKRTNYNFT